MRQRLGHCVPPRIFAMWRVHSVRYTPDPAQIDAHLAHITQNFLPQTAALAGVAGVHFLVADAQASGEVTAEQKARGTANSVPRFVLLLEGWGDEQAFNALAHHVFNPQTYQHFHLEDEPLLDLYRHQITRCKTAWSAG